MIITISGDYLGRDLIIEIELNCGHVIDNDNHKHFVKEVGKYLDSIDCEQIVEKSLKQECSTNYRRGDKGSRNRTSNGLLRIFT